MGNLHTTPITIDKTTPIRAIAFKKGFKPTNVDTHTYVRIEDVAVQDRQRSIEMGFPPSLVNAQVYRWGMNDDLYRTNPQVMKDALKSIPTVCLTMVQNDLTGSSGIYSNAGNRGWERPGNLEMINQNGDNLGNFGKNCGVRVRGNASRAATNPKHSFRIFFNSQYDGQLDFNWWKPQGAFADKGQTSLRHMDLRTSQNYGWQNNDVKNAFPREETSRDLMGVTGMPTAPAAITTSTSTASTGACSIRMNAATAATERTISAETMTTTTC